MDLVLKILGHMLFLACQPTGVLLSALLMPGSILILFSAVVFSASTGWQRPSIVVLVILAVLAILAEFLDNVMALLGVKRYGGTTHTSLGAGLGAIGGAFLASVVFSPLVVLLGGPVGWIMAVVFVPLLGAFAGGFGVAYLLELRRGADTEDARRAGYGAILGRVLGAVSKVTITAAMSITTVVAAFWPAH